MDDDFKRKSKALFDLAQLYESSMTLTKFQGDLLYRDVLLDLAKKIVEDLSRSLENRS